VYALTTHKEPHCGVFEVADRATFNQLCILHPNESDEHSDARNCRRAQRLWGNSSKPTHKSSPCLWNH
jgi:hypothetical protein